MQTGHQVAIKFLRRENLDVHVATREVVNQRTCARHPHIVQLHVRAVAPPPPPPPHTHTCACQISWSVTPKVQLVTQIHIALLLTIMRS